jgi:hypothetical protein
VKYTLRLLDTQGCKVSFLSWHDVLLMMALAAAEVHNLFVKMSSRGFSILRSFSVSPTDAFSVACCLRCSFLPGYCNSTAACFYLEGRGPNVSTNLRVSHICDFVLILAQILTVLFCAMNFNLLRASLRMDYWTWQVMSIICAPKRHITVQ